MRISIRRRVNWNYVGLVLAAAVCGTPQTASADVCHADDVVIDGSLGVGIDSTCNMSFGFDTIILRENNLRILFDDTSNSASFPNTDWRLTANDSSNGGGNYFSIDDATAGRKVFRVDAGAPTDSLRVDSAGDVGLGTATPVTELHIVDGDSPTVRLEQNGSSGFTPQTWDLAGNETNFFIRDVTNGSKLPFRIRPGAPSSSIDVAASGNVGIGDSSPAAALSVRNTDAVIRLEDAGTTGAEEGQAWIEAYDNGSTRLWVIGDRSPSAGGDDLFITADVGEVQFSAGTTDVQMRVTTQGTLALNPLSSSPTAPAGTIYAQIYVDTDGDLKVKFANGTTTTIATN